MNISVWSSYFYNMTPEDMVLTFAGKSWAHSELSDEHAATLLDRGDADRVGRQFSSFAADHGLCFPQGHLWLRCDIAGKDRIKTVDRLKRWLDLFLAIGIRAAVLHPAGHERYLAGDPPEAINEASAASLRILAEYLRGSALTICLENLFTHARTCNDLLDLIDAAGGDQLGICLDTGHLNLADRDQAAYIQQAGSWLQALHITDNQEKTDQHLLPYGPGTIDWLSVVTKLKEIGYRGLFNYEIPGERHAPLPVLLAKLDYIRTITSCMFAEAGIP
ncbi:MAG: sugar phosphate isomerase/epimerase family protein [Bacillota bacterium]|nr:sugar phosphate isomerase/epimerase family protein [Bacillota bacterium]